MANSIILKKSSVASKVPVVGDLDYGELALNYADGKLYYKKSDGTTIDYFSAGTGGITLPAQTGNSGKLLTTDGSTPSWTNLLDNVTIGNTTPASGTFTTLTATGQTDLGLNGSNNPTFRANAGTGAFPWVQTSHASGEARIRAAAASGAVPLSISSLGSQAVRFYTNAFTDLQFQVSNTASAVNYLQATGSATGARPTLSVQGSDTNIDLNVAAKGVGGFYVQPFSVFGASKFNNWTVDGALTGVSPFIRASGGDTNISATFQSKGTGALNLAPGSSGVNVSNGGTVTALTRTVGGSGYTSFPSITISAPTTAGGVQATATVTVMDLRVATIVSGGTGYTVNDVLTVSGGTGTAATLTVTSVSAGVITGISVTTFGSYTALPSNPVSVTGGTGSGATFTATYGVAAGAPFSITNAGSGYVEQPTVTFSGGGGSGAVAYASVGAGTIIRSLGSTGTQSLDFYTPAGLVTAVPILRLRDTSGDSYWTVSNQSTTTVLLASGNANANAFIGAAGSGFVSLRTGGGTQIEQLRVTNTSSAVNYVSVTGATTGNKPTISVQGSDTNVTLLLTGKGTGAVDTAFYHRIGASYANWVQISGAAAASTPSISVLGSDTNIDLQLTPKGTGSVIANGPLTVAGNTTLRGTLIDATSSGTAISLADVLQTTVASTTLTAVDTWPIATYRASKYLVQVTQGTSYQVSEIWVLHNGTTTTMTEYAVLETGSTLATFTSDIASTSARLLVTMASATSATINIQRLLMVV